MLIIIDLTHASGVELVGSEKRKRVVAMSIIRRVKFKLIKERELWPNFIVCWLPIKHHQCMSHYSC